MKIVSGNMRMALLSDALDTHSKTEDRVEFC